MSDAADERVVWLPAVLREKDLREAVGVGLFYLSLGHKPSAIPSGEPGSARVKLSEMARACLVKVAPEFGGEREAIVAALAWVAEQSAHVRLSRL